MASRISSRPYMQIIHTEPVDCTDQLSHIKTAILKVNNTKLRDVLEESDPVEFFKIYTSKPSLTIPSNTDELSLQACHDGKLNGFDSTVCNTCHSDEATTKPASLSSENQLSSLMVVSPNNYGQLKIKYHQFLEGSDAQFFIACKSIPIADGKATCYILVGNSQAKQKTNTKEQIKNMLNSLDDDTASHVHASDECVYKKIKGSDSDINSVTHTLRGHHSTNLLTLPTSSDSNGNEDREKEEKLKQSSKNILYLKEPNLIAHLHASDPAKGRKLNYEDLEDRMKTFKLPPQWEGPVDYQSMAEAGFVYTGQEDLVFCFSCNIKLDRWSKDMEPLLRHKEESPTCSFMRKKLQAVKGERGKMKSVVAPSKPLNSRLTSSIGQLQSSSLVASKSIHTVVTGLNEPRLSYGGSFDDRPGASLPITPENYQSEAERVKSFVGWPLNEAVHPEQLARVGFVYTGDGALVQCFQCGVKYRHWYKGDVPLNVHQKCNPRCPFLQTLSSKSKSPPPERRPTRSHIQPESLPISSNTQGEEVSKHSLQFPDYSDQAIRLQSFKHWGGVLPAYELAEAGFYMIARRDIVRCHSCNVVVQDWESSDNVIGEHKRHSPNCSFLKQFLSSRSNSELLSPLSSINKTGQTSIEKSVIRSRDNQFSQLSSTLEALPNSDIKPPSSIKSRSSSKSPDDGQEDTITGIRYPPSWGQHRSMSPQGASKKIAEGSDDSFHSAESHHKSDYTMMTSLDPPKTKIMYEESLSEGLENNISIKSADIRGDDGVGTGKGLCQICYDKKIDCIFLPCGHARTCEGCATRIKNSGQPCPYCRKGVSTTHHIYL